MVVGLEWCAWLTGRASGGAIRWKRQRGFDVFGTMSAGSRPSFGRALRRARSKVRSRFAGPTQAWRESWKEFWGVVSALSARDCEAWGGVASISIPDWADLVGKGRGGGRY